MTISLAKNPYNGMISIVLLPTSLYLLLGVQTALYVHDITVVEKLVKLLWSGDIGAKARLGSFLEWSPNSSELLLPKIPLKFLNYKNALHVYLTTKTCHRFSKSMPCTNGALVNFETLRVFMKFQENICNLLVFPFFLCGLHCYWRLL